MKTKSIKSFLIFLFGVNWIGTMGCGDTGSNIDDTATFTDTSSDSATNVDTDGTSTDTGGGTDVEITWIDCDGIDVDDALDVTEHIDEDAEWSGTVRVSGNRYVRNGAVLTIQPGTNVVFEPDATLEIGWNSSTSTVFAQGTAAEPIRFCGKVSEPGYWGGITIERNVTTNSVLEHVLISGAGGLDAALTLDQEITVKDVQVRNSGSDGVAAVAFNNESARLSVDGSTGYPVVLKADAAMDTFPLGGIFRDNDDNRISVTLNRVERDVVVHEPGIPYLQQETVLVRDEASIEFEAGVDYQFTADVNLEVGWNQSRAEILVMGTESAPVIFSGNTNTPGYWGGIIIEPNVLSSSSIRHAIIRDGGGKDQEVLELTAAIELQNVMLEGNTKGVYVSKAGFRNASSNLSITATEEVPMTIEADATVTLPEGGDYSGNGVDHIVILGGRYEKHGTIPALNIPYYVKGEITTREDSNMILTKGTTFLMGPDSHLEIGWNSQVATIVAVGTAAEPIVFEGASDSPGSWHGLTVGPNVTTNSAFEYVDMSDGGGDSRANLWLSRTGISVTNCSFSNSATYGMSILSADTAPYAADNSFSGNILDAIETR